MGFFVPNMSEELIQRGLTKNGLIIGNYQFYNIGKTTLNQLKKYKIVSDKKFNGYGDRQPDGLLVDRRNKNKIKVLLVTEHKDNGKFNSERDKVLMLDTFFLVPRRIG